MSSAPVVSGRATGPDSAGATPVGVTHSSHPFSNPAAQQQVSCPDSADLACQDSARPVSREAQARWAATSLAERLAVVRRARRHIALQPLSFAAAISPMLARSAADTLVAELLPLLDAMRFLERRARRLLSPRKLGSTGRPLWLSGVSSQVQRVPFGHILVIGPANFPLFLPGVQALQALVAGNAVTWKPGTGGERVARLFASALQEAGLPRGLLQVTDDTVASAQTALAAAPDKVVFTGSFQTGRQILRALAETATPAVMELSGADAVIVLPSADLPLVARAVAFGLRLNGAEVCMSPRRLVATADTLHRLRPLLAAALAEIPPVSLNERTATALDGLLEDALANGATLTGTLAPDAQRPLLIEGARPDLAIANSDIFAPVLTLLESPCPLHIAPLVNGSPYALTAAVFGGYREACALAAQLEVGTVLVNDLIAPTADPRVPFTGHRRSGFGATRGAEGLLEMTAPRTVLARRRGSARHYAPVGGRELPLFASLIGLLHAGTFAERFRAVRGLAGMGRPA